MHYLQRQLQTATRTRKLVYELRTKTIKQITTIIGTLQTTNSQIQKYEQPIDLTLRQTDN